MTGLAPLWGPDRYEAGRIFLSDPDSNHIGARCRAAHELGHWQQEQEDTKCWRMRKGLPYLVNASRCLFLATCWLFYIDSGWVWLSFAFMCILALWRQRSIVWCERDATKRAMLLLEPDERDWATTYLEAQLRSYHFR